MRKWLRDREGRTGKNEEGETLEDRILPGPVPVMEALPIFIQIAEGWEAVHGQGVIQIAVKERALSALFELLPPCKQRFG